MQWQDILLEFAKLIVPGFVGGLLAYWLGSKTFKSQKRLETKYQDDLRRRQALSDILVALRAVFVGIHTNWETPKGSTETSEQSISRLVEMYNRSRVLFLGDQDVLKVLDKFYGLIGTSFELLMKQEKNPAEIIAEIQRKLESKISEIEKSLY